MSKKVLQDIIARGKKIDHGSLERKWNYAEEEGVGIVDVEGDESEEEEFVDTDESQTDENVNRIPSKRKKVKRSRLKREIDYVERDGRFLSASKITVIVIIVLIVVGFIVASNIFSGATVKVLLMRQTEPIDTVLMVTDDGENGTIPYKKIVLEEVDTKSVVATDEQDVERKAEGTITVYNEHSTSPQRYVSGTRFQSPDGKIYRVQKAIVIPGMTEGGEPGSAEVQVFADQPGEAYNLEYVDFTIPGLKGGDSYEKVYARSKTPIKGGYIGVLRTASEDDVLVTEDGLRTALKKILMDKVALSIPEGYILFDDGVFIDFQSVSGNDEATDDSVVIEGKSTLRAFVFNESVLSQRIADRVISSYDGSPINVRNYSDISFRFLEKESFDFVNGTSFNVKVKGDVYLVWELDNAAFKEVLAGIKKDDFIGLAQQFPSVMKAQAKVQPFWRRVFPKNVDDILIEEMD